MAVRGIDLSPTYLQTLLERLDILNREFAALAGVSARTAYRWLNGTTPVPRSVILMLELLIERRSKA